MTEQEVKELLIKTNAIMEGHFLLTSGLHSPMYVEKFNVLQQPKYTEQLCKALAEYFADKNIDTVVGPMTGGILLAHEVGKALGTRAIFTERVDGKMTFRRGFSLKPGERVAIVEDIVQDVFASLWEENRIFPSQANFRSFLYISIRNAAFDYLRHQSG